MTDKLDNKSELNNEFQQSTENSTDTSTDVSDVVGNDKIAGDKSVGRSIYQSRREILPVETQYPFSLSTLITISSLVTLITGIVISDRLTLFMALPIALLFIAGIALYRMAFAREYNPNLSYNIYFSKTEQDVRTVTPPFKNNPIWRYIMIVSGLLFHILVVYIVVQYVSPSLMPLSSSISSPLPTPTP